MVESGLLFSINLLSDVLFSWATSISCSHNRFEVLLSCHVRPSVFSPKFGLFICGQAIFHLPPWEVFHWELSVVLACRQKLPSFVFVLNTFISPSILKDYFVGYSIPGSQSLLSVCVCVIITSSIIHEICSSTWSSLLTMVSALVLILLATSFKYFCLVAFQCFNLLAQFSYIFWNFTYSLLTIWLLWRLSYQGCT